MLLGARALLLVPAVTAMCRFATHRGSTLTATGALLAAMSVTMAGIAFTTEASVLAVASKPTLDRSAMGWFLDTFMTDPHASWPYNFTPVCCLASCCSPSG
jgi:hypothetical protein